MLPHVSMDLNQPLLNEAKYGSNSAITRYNAYIYLHPKDESPIQG